MPTLSRCGEALPESRAGQVSEPPPSPPLRKGHNRAEPMATLRAAGQYAGGVELSLQKEYTENKHIALVAEILPQNGAE